MEYINATKENAEDIFNLVQNTITSIYPKYYPQEVVDFFCRLHNKENILKDIENGCVGILFDNGNLVGTGSYNDNHITRVYVSPEYQQKGYGSHIIQNLEDRISEQYSTVYLDASLPASHLYEKRGYKTIEHNKYNVENDVILVYEVMKKSLSIANTKINYDGKTFAVNHNSENGEVSSNTVFNYHQNQDILWADYSGGEIVKGYLIGMVAQNGELDFYYQHINKNKQIKIGKCHSVPSVLKNGKIKLTEKWQWLNGDMSTGVSILIEK